LIFSLTTLPIFLGSGRWCCKGGRWGYVTPQGVLVIQGNFAYAADFSEGLAAVQIEGQYGYINTDGTLVIPPQFKNAGPFSEGLARVQVDDRWGFIDPAGHFITGTDGR
jgi:hypothetical protein